MKIMKYLKRPSNFILYLYSLGLFNLLEDKKYIKNLYKLNFGKKLDLKHPKSFNEKLNYLKLYDRNPLYTVLADKILVKEYVSKKIGDEYVIPLYQTYDSVEDIMLDKLPDKFVLKCNHDSGGAFICRDKNSFNFDLTKKKIKTNLKKNWFYSNREWPYKNIKPRILAEKYIDDPTSNDLIDYKFLCFNGQPKYVYTTVKNSDIYENYYDMNFNIIDINHGFPRRNPEFDKPKNFDLMVKLVEKLSKDIPFVRIDMHNIDGKIYFGEFTFYDWAGMRPYKDFETDIMLGKLLDIK